MEVLQDKNLIDCYLKAIELKLDREFINLLKKELQKRNLMAQLNVKQ